MEELKKEEDEILAAIFAAVNDEVPKLEPPLQPIIPAKNIYFKLHLGFRQKQKLQDWLYLYHLGPPITPAHEVKAGKKIVRSMRVWAALDLLLTCKTIQEARDKTDQRIEKR